MSIVTASAEAFFSKIADLVDGSSDRYARAFGPLLADGKPRVAKAPRQVSVFRQA